MSLHSSLQAHTFFLAIVWHSENNTNKMGRKEKNFMDVGVLLSKCLVNVIFLEMTEKFHVV